MIFCGSATAAMRRMTSASSGETFLIAADIALPSYPSRVAAESPDHHRARTSRPAVRTPPEDGLPGSGMRFARFANPTAALQIDFSLR